MGKKNKFIADPTDPSYIQGALFPQERSSYNPYPRLPRNREEALEQFENCLQEGLAYGKVGCDLEFNKYRPTVLGIAAPSQAVAVPWDNDLARRVVAECQRQGATIVGHSTIGAEKQQFEKALDITTPTDLYDCSMILHHLVNADFTKLTGKEEGEESGALGLMGLWTVASIYTDLPHWKECRGSHCEGPCPKHDVWGYCAVDAWASLAAFDRLATEAKALNIPWGFYRDRMDLTYVCLQMENNGLNVNRAWVDHMEKHGQELKDSLFPWELVNGKPKFKQFNPKSGPQVLAYCQANSIDLQATTKGDVLAALEKQAKREGYEGKNADALCERLEEYKAELSSNLDTLYRLYQYKASGKGVTSWFADKYFGPDGRIHPRFVTTGASTGRLSSSRPNMQNLGNKGWAEELKKAIIPTEGYDFLESDFSQLELRVVLFLAGYDMGAIGKDAFTWLAANSNGMFSRAATNLGLSERDVAKSISHGADYLEGIQVLSPGDLASSRIRSEIEYGARVVYQKKYKPRLSRDWDYRGGVVSFTGGNLSERLFGDKSLANRKRALEIVEDVYFEQFFEIREWQMRVLAQAEQGYVQNPAGRYLRLYGKPEDDAKVAVAFYGQGVGAEHVQAVMLRFYRELNRIPAINVHDSLVFEIPKEMTNEAAKEFIGLMQEETTVLPGFSAPGKIKRGPTYGEIKQI